MVRLIARPGYYSPDSVKDESENGKPRKRAERAANGTASGSGGCKVLVLSPATVLEQAKAALWLLCRYGGVGAKARKGFGSFEDVPDMNLQKCKEAAMNLRRECGLHDAFSSERAETPSLEEMMGFELPTAWDDPWFALDQVGYAVQSFARNHARDLAKKALGLPRRIGSPVRGEFNPVKCIGDRHASPVLYHLSKDSNGKIMVRVTAFVAKRLPSPEKSKSFLTDFLDYLKPELEARAAGGIVPPGSTSMSSLNQTKHAGAKGPRAAAPALSPARPATRSPTGVTPTPDERLVPGDRVEVELLEEKTKKGGWKAKAVVSGKIGPIQNTKDVPGDKKPGERAIVYVHSASSEAVQFLWPTPEVEARFRRRDGGNRPNNPPGNRNR
ncbi:MAG TPA: hypothetical protein GX513_06195 [Firmicutes bacterium]|nr:hypothetical protein [Bacillota bacterium]